MVTNTEWQTTTKAIVERFNKTYREDILDAYLFKSISHAQQLTDDWVEDYNTNRPHQGLNYLTPVEYKA
ncbi:MAG: transposase [Cyclobacteriaceae bacterium]|nr:transposase [Cyclobacteriaceae bacterium]